jgi:hypothetical protein
VISRFVEKDSWVYLCIILFLMISFTVAAMLLHSHTAIIASALFGAYFFFRVSQVNFVNSCRDFLR